MMAGDRGKCTREATDVQDTTSQEETRARVDCRGPFIKSVFGNGSGHHMNEVCCGLRSGLALQHRGSIYEAYEGYAMCHDEQPRNLAFAYLSLVTVTRHTPLAGWGIA